MGIYYGAYIMGMNGEYLPQKPGKIMEIYGNLVDLNGEVI